VIPGVNAHILPVALDINIWKNFLATGKSGDGTIHTDDNGVRPATVRQPRSAPTAPSTLKNTGRSGSGGCFANKVSHGSLPRFDG
jgi:hypothetical protein